MRTSKQWAVGPPPSPYEPYVVVFRPLSARTFLVPLLITALLAVGVTGGMVTSPSPPSTTAVAVTVTLLVAFLVLSCVVSYTVTKSAGHTWDLAAQTITYKGRTYAFSEVTRVVVCSGAKGWRGLLFATPEGRIRSMAVNINGYGKQSMGREQWIAVRALLAAPHVPTFERYPMVTWGPGDIDRRGPQSLRRGPAALAVVDAQIAWIDAGRRPNASNAPIDLYRRGR